MKLKIRQSSSSRAPDPKPQTKKELYGLDIDFLQGLGLGDMLEDSPQKSEPGNSGSKMHNMTYEELRQQFNQDGVNSHVGKLRGACKQYNEIY
jgi:hypothetical protein